jgi:hypothetical protein
MADPYVALGEPVDPYAAISEPAADQVVGQSHNGGVTISVERPQGVAANLAGAAATLNRSIPFVDEASDAVRAFLQTGADLATGKAHLQPEVGKTALQSASDIIRQHYLANQGRTAALAQGFETAHPVASDLVKGAGMAIQAVPAMATAGASAVPEVAASAAPARGLLAASARALKPGADSAVTAGLAAQVNGLGSEGTLQQRLQNANEATVPAMVVGGAIPAVFGAARAARRGTAAGLKAIGVGETPASTTDPVALEQQLFGAKNAAYKAADDAGAIYTPEAVNSLVTGVGDEMKAAKINPDLHPAASAMLKSLDDYRDTPLSLTDLDQLRQVINRDVTNAPGGGDQFLGRKMVKNIDEFIDAATPEQMIGADPQRAADLIKAARQANTQYAKLKAINDAVRSAEIAAGRSGSGGNINNATRSKLSRYIDPLHSAEITNLTPDEQQLLDQIVTGTKGTNALRQIGKFSPEGNGLIGALQGASAVASHGATLPVAVAGMAAKRAADQATADRVATLLQTIAQGGTKAAPAAAPAAANFSLPQWLAVQRALAMGSGAASARAQ